jgi:nucleoid-associated protein YgaU
MLEKSFNPGHGGGGSNSALLSTTTPSAQAMPSNLSQPVTIASSNAVPSSFNVGSSSFGAQPSAAAAVGNLNTADGGSLNSALSSSSGDTGNFGPSGAVSDKLGNGHELLAMGKGGDAGATNGSEYGANFIKQQPSSSSPVEGLKAKELTLESVKGGHKLASTGADHGNALEKLHKASHDVTKHTSSHAHSTNSSNSSTSTKPSGTNATAKTHSADQRDQTEIANGDQIAPQDGADTAGADYTIKSGDCLWDIAKDKLGDATKWSEIFKLNSDTLGANPSLIHPGATIHLPGQSLAGHATEASKYIVKSGDNLWNISKSHLGDATKWGEVYKLNHELIGANPSLIRPGTELTLPGTPDGASGQLADASGATTAAPGAEAAPEAAAAAPDQVAQAVPDTNAPAAFGHPNGANHFSQPEASMAHPNQPVAETHLPPQSLDTSLPPSGAATAAPIAGPGAAGAATLPTSAPTHVAPSNSPENAGVVSSSVGNDLANFLSRKK